MSLEKPLPTWEEPRQTVLRRYVIASVTWAELECGHHMTATGKDLYGSIRCCWCPPVKRGTFEPVQGW